MSHNIHNPVVPYIGPIAGPLSPGRTITIRGNVFPNCNRFAINLQNGPNVYPRDDVALHIGVDFLRNCIVRNNIQKMNWGPEETDGGFPFVRGSLFDIAICCEAMHYRILVSGQHFCTFEHRMVFHRVSHLAVDGEISLTSIDYMSSVQCPPPYPGPLPPYPTSPLSPFSPHPTSYPMTNQVTSPPYAHQPVGGTAFNYNQQPMPMHNNNGFGGVLNKAGAAVAGLAAAAGLKSAMGHGHHGHKSNSYLGPAVGAGIAGAALTGHLSPKKMLKKNKKARKKALKYGIPLAGAGLGAYALHKTLHSSSSSSSSSSSGEE
ncbi:hypothetical protein LSTR_LSTR001273 [Laodelphax striatellus]|uniref:Galectin n=1 Tax=Laodelphax striatellus TaxID=195883 RepID=A0A482XAV3_LAOST|nr:hypothetical protein LSTR_LSTR001273 [Laodelphax striatellus]